MSEYLKKLSTDYDISFNLFKDLITTEYSLRFFPPVHAEGRDFGEEFPGSLIRKPFYKNCRFSNSSFFPVDRNTSMSRKND